MIVHIKNSLMLKKDLGSKIWFHNREYIIIGILEGEKPGTPYKNKGYTRVELKRFKKI